MISRNWVSALPAQAAAHGAGAAAGLAASLAGLPLPWLLGGLIGSAALAAALPAGIGGPWRPSAVLRDIFVVVIGVMIGGAFSPELLRSAEGWGPSLAGVAVFCLLAQGMIYILFRRFGMDRATAWFSASPGGLVENILLGEAAGGDTRRITLLQLGRIVCVVTLLPLAFSLWEGRAVGSAAGAAAPATGTLAAGDALILIAAGVAGWAAARAARIPAGAIIGPVAASAAVHAFGLTDGQVPGWLVSLAQLMVGVALGLRFGGLGARDMGGALALSLVSVLAMLVLAVGVAAAVAPWSREGAEVLALSYAPGGIIEMGLIALTLGSNPVFVTVHHVARVLFTVTVTPGLFRFFLSGPR